MSFRRNANRHDAWIAYRTRAAAQLASIGLPPDLYENEYSLADFLTTGHHAGLQLTLHNLTDPQFWALFHFASSWYDYASADFKAMEQRRLGAAPLDQQY